MQHVYLLKPACHDSVPPCACVKGCRQHCCCLLCSVPFVSARVCCCTALATNSVLPCAQVADSYAIHIGSSTGACPGNGGRRPLLDVLSCIDHEKQKPSFSCHFTHTRMSFNAHTHARTRAHTHTHTHTHHHHHHHNNNNNNTNPARPPQATARACSSASR